MTVPERHNAKIEVQIRTPEMHEVAEFGVAAHWIYKQGEGIAPNRKRYPWVRDLLEILESASDPQDFLGRGRGYRWFMMWFQILFRYRFR